MKYYRSHVLVSINDTSINAGVKDFIQALRAELAKTGLQEEINVLETGPLGFFGRGICLTVYPENINYQDLKTEDIPELVNEHFLKGRPVPRLMLDSDSKFSPKLNYDQRVVLRNSGIIDPENIDEYIGVGGYEAWEKALTQMQPMEIVEEVKASGLRGRGGAGFPAGIKWSFTAPLEAEQKYVVVNADEGEPGTFKDRLIMEGDPHQLLEGTMICARAVGATKAWIYIRGEYKLCIQRLEKAIAQAREYGILGKNIFDSGFDLDIEIKIGAGAYVCGEETALIESLEGNRGNPRWKPPFPGVEGLWRKPTVVNNVETFGNVPTIIRKGAEWFYSMGTEKSKGTKVFALTGDIRNTGLVEVPMGITLRELIFDVGGGIIGDGKFKAVQLGGPSGGCLTVDHLDVGVDYESLKERGAMMGSGGVIVMNDEKCMVNVAKFFMDFCVEESCGKCSPCRIGLKQMLEILERITSGKGREGDIEELQRLGESISKLSLCGLGQTAPNPVLSTIRYFREEYEAHIRDKSCSNKVCLDLMHFNIDKERCIGCSLCARKCPVTCITGSREEKYTIHQIECIKCGNCFDVCPVKAIDKIPGIHPDTAAHLDKLGKAIKSYED